MNVHYRPKPPWVATHESWPPDYVGVFAWRQQQLAKIRHNATLLAAAKIYYSTRPVEFICHWVDTYDPRKLGTGMAHMPFVLFERQADMVDFLQAMVDNQENGLIEKCRDAGATWVCAAFSVWLWLFKDGASVGWGSRKEALVDRIGDPDGIFEKMRMVIRRLPEEFLPANFSKKDDMPFLRIMNPDTGAIIAGEAGDNIGRGGRSLVYFKDEAAHYERPTLIEAALADNTNVQIDISSVNGIGNVFHRRREAGVEWEGEIEKGKTHVFVVDWTDHPEKDQTWYDRRRSRAAEEGLLHVFKQEVDRDYAASVEGIIIRPEWVKAAIDAHIKLEWGEPTGKLMAGLDVADEGGDKNALLIKRGWMVLSSDAWGEGDTGETARKAAEIMGPQGGKIKGEPSELYYDSVSVGAGVKSEVNRLIAVNLWPENVSVHGWAGSNAVLFPDDHMLKTEEGLPDTTSMKNKDFFGNLKAQAWWQLARRFERTWRAVEQGVWYDPDELISLPSDLPGLRKLQKELSQAVMKKSTATMKFIVDKNPDGTFSPNRADSLVIVYWPYNASTYNLEGLLS